MRFVILEGRILFHNAGGRPERVLVRWYLRLGVLYLELEQSGHRVIACYHLSCVLCLVLRYQLQWEYHLHRMVPEEAAVMLKRLLSCCDIHPRDLEHVSDIRICLGRIVILEATILFHDVARAGASGW